MKRREFIKTAAGASLLIPGILSGCQRQGNIQTVSANADVMDEALKLIVDFAPLSNHAPMAVEALVAIGRADRVIPFIESYRKRFSSDYPPKYKSVTKDNWKEALNDERRTTDWIDFFNREIKENGWKMTVETWSERLAPGLSAAAAHGLIRTGHAVRSLGRNENEARKNELAHALAYWAAYYQVLPEIKNAKNQKLNLSDAIQKVPVLPSEKRNRGSIMNQLKALDDFPSFSETINLVDVTNQPETILTALTELFATIYAKNVSPRNNIDLIHAVTGLANVRALVPYLSKPMTEKMLRYGWQAAAAIYSISGNETNNQISDAKINREDLIEQAVTSNEEHAIKFTEACVSEYKLNPNPIYLRAANDALGRLQRHS